MAAFWIGRAQQLDEDYYREYARLREIATVKYADVYPHLTLVRAGDYQVMEGENAFNRYVIHQFRTAEEAAGYFNSPEYQAAAAVRRLGSGKCEMIIANGTT